MSTAEWADNPVDDDVESIPQVKLVVDEQAFFRWTKAGNLEEFLRILSIPGVSTEMRDKRGFTPLIIASLHGHDKLMTILLEKGANVNAKTDAGDTALHWYERARHAS